MRPRVKNNPASALLVVVIGTAGLMMLLFTCWQIGSWYDDVMVERVLYIKRFYATEFVLNSGLTLVVRQFDILRSTLAGRSEPVVLSVPAGQIDGRPVESRVTVALPPGLDSGVQLLVRAVLVDGGHPVCCLACLVEKVTQKSKNEASFVAHHFTSQAFG